MSGVIDKRYSLGSANLFKQPQPNSIIQLGVVKVVGEIPVNNSTEAQRRRDEVFNSDPNMIRVRIESNQYDQAITDDRLLPNCYPILPKHLNIVPKIGEVVFIMLLDPTDRYSDRLYLGPMISSRENLKEDRIDTTALSNLSISVTTPNVNLDTLKSVKGIFPNREDVSIQGRDNSDIIFKTNEALLRAGQHVQDNVIVFNDKNPAYVQLKFNTTTQKNDNANNNLPSFGNSVNRNTTGSGVINGVNFTTSDVVTTNAPKTSQRRRSGCPFAPDSNPSTDGFSGCGGRNANKGSVINMVADKINLIGHKDTDRKYNVTNNETYISEQEIVNIIETAHPVAFGDTLLDYLKKLELAFMNHVHRFPGLKPSAVQGENYLKEYLEYPVQTILSKNIRIN